MKSSLFAVFAHPDDESFGVGGTLAKYAAIGTRVVFVCATRGEVGEISDASLATPVEEKHRKDNHPILLRHRLNFAYKLWREK